MDRRKRQRIMTVKDEINKKANTDQTESDKKTAAVYAEKAGTDVPELSEEQIRAFALAYARYLNDHNMAPGDATFVEPEDIGLAGQEETPAKSYGLDAESAAYVISQPDGADADEKARAEEQRRAAAAAEAEKARKAAAAEAEKARKAAAAEAEKARKAAAAEAERARKAAAAEAEKARKAAAAEAEIAKKAAAAAEAGIAKKAAKAAEAEERKKQAAEAKEKKRQQKLKKQQAKRRKKAGAAKKDAKEAFRSGRVGKEPLAAVLELHDRLQDRSDEAFRKFAVDLAKGIHSITSTYRNSRRSIGIGILVVGLFAAALLVVFDRFTVYEYAYNGKVLGYVSEQDEITDVLEVAGKELSQNNTGEADVEFTANQNVTFNLVDGRGKSTDDADTAVNKLIYLTDIETDAYGIYEIEEAEDENGEAAEKQKLVAVVKDQAEAEELLEQTMSTLSIPDSGMELVSADFSNKMDIRPVKVLLSSVQSSARALDQMVNGGSMETYHIVEADESLADLTETFGTEAINIYDEDNKEVAEEVEQGDKVCIRQTVDPVSVEMVETGRMKEVIEFETIKKKTDEYYKGETHTQQEGENRVQIFEGTLTKVGGEVTDRDEKSIEVIKKGHDKIILVGTKDRPKTAPTGTYALPIKTYVVTSEFGGRWGRMHEGMDFGAATGTPIYAADGGTVVRAEYYSGYGLCVEIDHEHGRLTRYAHCSQVLVNRGDRVYQGQNIALVGNTGHSFGSHLHFETRQDGTALNPRNFIKP